MEQHTPGFDASPRQGNGPLPNQAPPADLSGAANRATAPHLGATTGPPAEVPPHRFHDEVRPRSRRVGLPLVLFVATCFSTFFSGSIATTFVQGGPVRVDLRGGLVYMAAVM